VHQFIKDVAATLKFGIKKMEATIFLQTGRHRTSRDLRDVETYIECNGKVFFDFPIFGETGSFFQKTEQYSKEELLARNTEGKPNGYGFCPIFPNIRGELTKVGEDKDGAYYRFVQTTKT